MYNDPAWELYCHSLIAICPNIAEAYRHKAIPYIKNGEYAKAFALEDKAVALDPQGYTAYRGFLKCLFTKDYKGAIEDFQKAQQLAPGGYEMDHTYKFYEGLCDLELGNYQQAEQYLQKCLAQYAELPEANYYLALVYQRGGRTDLKKKYLEIAEQSVQERYTMNEDNLFYANYPHQVKRYEIEKALEH